MSEIWKDKYGILKEELTQRGVNVEKVKESLKGLKIETPSWGYRDAGTRFATFEAVRSKKHRRPAKGRR